jgi:hypothetical protein
MKASVSVPARAASAAATQRRCNAPITSARFHAKKGAKGKAMRTKPIKGVKVKLK